VIQETAVQQEDKQDKPYKARCPRRAGLCYGVIATKHVGPLETAIVDDECSYARATMYAQARVDLKCLIQARKQVDAR
jgi:hypothetical protein